jgi:REP element-mobilizing transposase RayT
MDKPNRHSARFRGFDYSACGAYFITICTNHHRPFFGVIENGMVKPNWVGTIVEREWIRTTAIRPEIALDEFVVMPNHFHAIISITPPNVGTQRAASADFTPDSSDDRTQHAASLRKNGVGGATENNVTARSLSAVVRAFKSAVTRAVNQHRATRNQSPVVVWQSRFHDRIIRDETELLNTRRYIVENPINWHEDEYS